MKKIFKPLLFIVLFLTVFFVGACSSNTENEHLPEYCQTYAGFTSVASKDFYDLLREQSDISVVRSDYIGAISQISLEFDVDDPNREIDLSGIQCFQNLTSLTLIGRSFKDLSPISALSNIQSIELRGTSVVSIDSFKNLSKIKSLKISETRTLQSVKGVEEMTKLTDLDLSSNGIVVIDGLNNLINLETLYLNDNEIVSFPSINQLEFLTTLDISDNNINQLGEDLSGLSKLTTLNAQNNEICDLSTLDDLVSLEILNLSNNDLGCGGTGVSPNFDSLENAPNLEELYLDNNNLTSIEGLRGRDINLEILHINDNNLTDITPIGEYTGIKELYLFNNNISDIDDLSGMIGLTNIDLSKNNIDDFSDLLTITSLVSINLSFNNITVIPDISSSWSNLSILDLSSNNLTDTSGVNGHPTIESLIIYNNGLIELRGISNLPELDNLVIFDELLESELDPLDENPNYIQVIRNSFNNLESLEVQVDNEFDFGFELGDSIEIYGSINGLTDIDTIRFTGMDIDIIDDLSINLPNLRELYVDENNITDISFIMGNPLLERLYINDNVISNLQVISGVGTSDLDNLEHVVASNITSDNNLVDSFIQLPNLSTIDLTETSIVSISNSFNDLSSLTLINFEADNLVTIHSSFNNIFSTYEVTNRFVFNEGMIGVISNSFNNGFYDRIAITNQVTTESITIIEHSFNNINVEDVQGIVIEASLFSNIDNSFKGIETDVLSVSNNEVEIITASFIDSIFNSELDLSDNLLETVPSLSLVTSVNEVNLSTNHLTTLSFLDEIPGLETLDISIQRDELTTSYTLESINGINNMPSLTDLVIGDIGVTSIDGLRNIGLSSFEFSYSDNNDKYISNISPTSFSGTPLTTLDLDEYELDDITFIDNLDILESLYIGIDLADLSDFHGQDFETTLAVIGIVNNQNILDISYLSNYDVVTNLTLSSPLTTTINNLNGMDSLVSLTLDFDLITEITNSFNNLSNFNLNNTYLEQFSALDTITNSFDIYGDSNHSGMVNLSAEITVTDSFNNLETLNLNDNDGDLVPNFDTLSFSNIDTIQFEYGSYSSLIFLNTYPNLTNVTFTELNVGITDLANENIELLLILSADSTITTFDLELSDVAVFELTSLRNGQIDIDGNFASYNLDTQNADIVIISTATVQSISANIQDMTLNADLATSVELQNYTSNNTTFNTDLLTTINRVTTFETNASLFTINSLESTLNISIKSDSLVVNDNNAIEYILNVVGGVITLNNEEPNIDVEAYGTDLNVNYNELQYLTLSGTVGIANITSTNLNTVATLASTVTTLNIDSNQAIMSLSGSNITTLNLTNNDINGLTANINNADLNITTTNFELLNATVMADTVTLTANSVASVVISNTSTIETLDLTNNVILNTLTYGTSSINSIELTTSEAVLTVSGSATTMVISGAIMNTLNIESPLSSVKIIDSADILSVDVDIDSLLFDNTTLTTLNMVALGSVDTLTVDNSSAFTMLNSNDSNITNLSILSDVPVLTIDAVNASTTTIEGSNFLSITANFGVGNLSLESSNNDSLSLNLTAGTVLFGSSGTTNTTELIINDLSTVTSFEATAPNLQNLNSGTASLTSLEIFDSSSNLDVIGSGIDAILITGNISILDIFASLGTSLVIDSSRITGTDITTNTSQMDLTVAGDSNVTSNTLENITFDVGVNDIEFIVNKTNLDFTIDGLAETVIINGVDVDTVITTANTDIGTLQLNTIDANILDFTLGIIDNLDVTTLSATFSIIGDEVESVLIEGVNLITFNATSSNVNSELILTTGNTTLDLISNMNAIEITNNNLTSLDITGVTTALLTIQANSLSSLDTGTSVSNIVDITTTQITFTLHTSAPTIDFIGSTIGTLNLTNTNTSLTVLNTNTDILDVESNSANLSINSNNLNQIIGNTTGTLSLDLSVTGTLVLTNNTVTNIIFTGANTIDELDIRSTSISTLNTNTVDINTLIYEADANDTIVTSNTAEVELSTTGNAEITLNYGGSTILNLKANIGTTVNVNLSTASALDVEGEVTIITISGANINTVTTDLLTVYNTLTMNGTLISDLDFISSDVLVNVDTIEVDTLSNTNIDSIMSIIDNSFIDVISPIVDLDVYNYYYDGQIIVLEAQEAIDTIRYDGFRENAINAAWSKIITNQYMDHLNESDTKDEIDVQIYQTVDEYYQRYLTNDGIDEAGLTPTEIQDIKDAIQTTLDDPLLTISEVALEAQVTASIITDATTYANTEQTNDTFTLS